MGAKNIWKKHNNNKIRFQVQMDATNLTKKNDKKANKENVTKENIGVHLTVLRCQINSFLKFHGKNGRNGLERPKRLFLSWP